MKQRSDRQIEQVPRLPAIQPPPLLDEMILQSDAQVTRQHRDIA